MDLQSELGLTESIPNAMQSALLRLGATAGGTAVFAAVLGPLDRVAYRLTGGRRTLGRSLGALPVVMLTTTGARTGQTRTTPLNAFPVADDLAVIGTNYGRGTTPGWAHNLRANPQATLSHLGRTVSVVARPATAEQYEAVFAEAIRVYAGYARYRKKAVNEVPVFILKSEGAA